MRIRPLCHPSVVKVARPYRERRSGRKPRRRSRQAVRRISLLPPDCSREPARGESNTIGHRKGREQARGYNQPGGCEPCRW
ncbi:MAG: hypothetical protein ABSA97_10785 [Verrucomicrobiia bacterium]